MKMSKTEEHPTVRDYYRKRGNIYSSKKNIDLSGRLDPEWLRNIRINAGADDVGFVDLEHHGSPGKETIYSLTSPGRGLS
jgi:hypothetical protein